MTRKEITLVAITACALWSMVFVAVLLWVTGGEGPSVDDGGRVVVVMLWTLIVPMLTWGSTEFIKWMLQDG